MNLRLPLRVPLVGLVASMSLVTGCGDDAPEQEGPVTLEVTIQDWTGWQREQPEPTVRTVTVATDDSFTVDTTVGEVTVTVVGIDEEEIELETSERLAPAGDGGGIDLNDLGTRFALDRDGAVELATATLDAGTSVTVAE